MRRHQVEETELASVHSVILGLWLNPARRAPLSDDLAAFR